MGRMHQPSLTHFTLGIGGPVPKPSETCIPPNWPACHPLDLAGVGVSQLDFYPRKVTTLRAPDSSLHSPPSSQHADLDGVIHEGLQQQRLPSAGRRQQGPGQGRPGAGLGQLAACPGPCPARQPWLSPGDLHRRKKVTLRHTAVIVSVGGN